MWFGETTSHPVAIRSRLEDASPIKVGHMMSDEFAQFPGDYSIEDADGSGAELVFTEAGEARSAALFSCSRGMRHLGRPGCVWRNPS